MPRWCVSLATTERGSWLTPSIWRATTAALSRSRQGRARQTWNATAKPARAEAESRSLGPRDRYEAEFRANVFLRCMRDRGWQRVADEASEPDGSTG
jgi:hypothetical protein